MAPCKRNGCAFFGSDATEGYCSKCHKARVQTVPKATNSTHQSLGVETIAKPAVTVVDPQRHAAEAKEDTNLTVLQSEPGSSGHGEQEAVDAAIMAEIAAEGRQQGDGAVRCYSCNKRLRLADNFLCRCGEVFCSLHRHYKDHSCTYDYKASGRAAIAKANPIVTGSKLKKI